MVVESREELERGEVTAPSRGNLVVGRVLDNRTLKREDIGLSQVRGSAGPPPGALWGSEETNQTQPNLSASLTHHLLSTYCIPGPSHALRENRGPKITSTFF